MEIASINICCLKWDFWWGKATISSLIEEVNMRKCHGESWSYSYAIGLSTPKPIEPLPHLLENETPQQQEDDLLLNTNQFHHTLSWILRTHHSNFMPSYAYALNTK